MHSKHFQYLYEQYKVQAREQYETYMYIYTLQDVIPWWGKGETFVDNSLCQFLAPIHKNI